MQLLDKEFTSQQIFEAICNDIEYKGFPSIDYSKIQRGSDKSEINQGEWHEYGNWEHRVSKTKTHTTILFRKLYVPELPFGVVIDSIKEPMFEVEYKESFCSACGKMHRRTAVVYDNLRRVARPIQMGRGIETVSE